MPTYAEEVLHPAKLDYTNPLAQYFDIALTPDGTTGLGVWDAVSQQYISDTSGFTLLSNGAIRGSGGDGANLFGTSVMPPLDIIGKDLDTHSFIFSLKFKNGDNANQSNYMLFANFGHPSDFWEVEDLPYDDGVNLRLSADYVNDIWDFAYQANSYHTNIYTYWWDAPNQKLKVWVDGIFWSERTKPSGTFTSIDNFRLGLGNNVSQFFWSYLLGKSTSFTQEEVDAAIYDPYQVFKTREDTVNDYGLKLVAAGETLTVSGLVGSWTATLYNADDTTAATSGSGNYSVNGQVVKHIKKIEIIDDNGMQFIDCNRTTGDPVNLTGDATIALSSLPIESGYVTESGEIVGYALNDASHTISYPLVGAWSGTITYSDDTTTAPNGSGTYVLDGTSAITIKHFTVADSNGTQEYDHTTGDVDSIPNISGSNHATITAKTSGWMPIIERQVFTIAASGADYTTPGAMMNNTQNQPDNLPVGIISGVVAGGSMTETSRGTNSTHPNGIELIATPEQYFNGDINATLAGITGGVYTRLTKMVLKGLSMPSGVRPEQWEPHNWLIERCLFNIPNGGANAGIDFRGGGSTIVKQSMVINATRSGFFGESTDIYLDCIAISCNTSNYEYAQGFEGEATCIDCISYNNLNGDYDGTLDLSNCVSSDATGSIPNVDFTGAFFDG